MALDPQLLGDLTGAELFIFEAEASEHGTPQEVRAAREELARRVGRTLAPYPAFPAPR